MKKVMKKIWNNLACQYACIVHYVKEAFNKFLTKNLFKKFQEAGERKEKGSGGA